LLLFSCVFFFVFEVVKLVIEVVDQDQLGALSSGVSRVFFGESCIEVCDIEFVLELRHDWRLELELDQVVEVDVGEPRVLLDGVGVAFVAESFVRTLFEELVRDRLLR
jgi:hypothetical protein